jgi:aminopeptidase N
MRFILLVFVLACSLPSFAQEIDVLHYNYAIDLNDHDDTIKGTALITLIKKSDKQTIALDLGSVNKDGKGMTATVRFGQETLGYTHKADQLNIELPKHKKGDTLTLAVIYKGIPADGLVISKNKYGDRTFFADNWPNRAHYWIPCKDVPDDKASFEFSVVAPSQYKVISNGVKVEQKNVNGITMTHWKEDTPLPTKVMVIGAAKFAVKEFPDSPPNIPVSAWVYQQDSTKGIHDYAPATEILKFFSGYIAPYPYNKLANVQSKTIFGGMENASAIFYAENSVTGKGGAEGLLAHEIAHQWFGDMASEKSFAHLWLSEGFATYLTNIYFEKKYGKDTVEKRMAKDRQDVIRFAKENSVPVVDSTSDLMSLLNANSYQKGSWVLHMLRHEVGDTTFRKIIQAYYTQYKGSNADTRDFEKVAETVSGKDLKWFFDQWLYTGGVPELEIKTDIDKGEVKVKVKQGEKLYRLTMEVGLVQEDGTIKMEKMEINEKEVEYKWKVGGVKNVVLDPGTELLFVEAG